MAEFYRSSFGDNSNKNTPLWLVIADVLMWAITIVTLAALLIIFMGRFISPERMWYFSLLGLAAPAFYIAAILAMLYWIIRWKWIPITVTGIFVIAGLFHVSMYYKLDLSKQYGEESYDKSCIKVLTFNTRSFHDDNWDSTVDSVAKTVVSINPDIICFQEFLLDPKRKAEIIERLSDYNMSGKRFESGSSLSECFTKYPVCAVYKIEFEGTGSCTCTDLRINDDTVRIYNVHLQTTSVTSADKSYISNAEFIEDSTRDSRFIQIAQSLRKNNAVRARQAEIIRNDMEECPYPIILCGDFNDVPVSYTYRTMSSGLEDAFRRKGHKYACTYRGFFDALRIDYVFSSPDLFTVESCEILPTGDISDHYPVFVRLKLTSKQ